MHEKLLGDVLVHVPLSKQGAEMQGSRNSSQLSPEKSGRQLHVKLLLLSLEHVPLFKQGSDRQGSRKLSQRPPV